MLYLIYPFLTAAVAGLIAGLGLHAAVLLGWRIPPQAMNTLFLGMFIVWLPTVLIGNRLADGFKRKDFWKAALRGCPKWLQRAVWIVAGYGWGMSMLFLLLHAGRNDSAETSPLAMIPFALPFYVVAVGVLYSGAQVQRRGVPRCANGHSVNGFAKYCAECGAPVMDPAGDGSHERSQC